MPSKCSLISCVSSTRVDAPVLQVFSLVAVPGLGELLLLLEVDLPLLIEEDSIFEVIVRNRMKRWARLGSACTGLVLQIRLLRHGKSTYGCGSRSRSSYIYMCVCVCVECMLPILLVQCSFLHYIYQSIQ